jgi:hypothetical protein
MMLLSRGNAALENRRIILMPYHLLLLSLSTTTCWKSSVPYPLDPFQTLSAERIPGNLVPPELQNGRTSFLLLGLVITSNHSTCRQIKKSHKCQHGSGTTVHKIYVLNFSTP